MTEPTLVFLHALGASVKEWKAVLEHLPAHHCVTLDIPGFGEAAQRGYVDVGAMADWLADEIRSRALTSCMLIGHSMGGKIVTLVAARAAHGEIGLSGILGVVLVAASPPAPEPMDEDRRAEMIGWFTDGRPSRADAETFVDANTASRLPPSVRDAAIEDVRRSSREAWLGWLERGSCEDWSADAGRITIPALILAGAEDGDLGADAQGKLNLPHFVTADMRIVEGAAHLIPCEQPEVLAALIEDHTARITQIELPADFMALLASDRVSRRTRMALLDRLRPPPPATAWTAEHRATTAALITQILPDAGNTAVLADRILNGIADGTGDGWRYAALPSDREAWRRGLTTMAASGFVDLEPGAQTRLLERVTDGDIGSREDGAQLSPDQMALWFEDVRAETVRVWMSLPTTMAAIGYDGFAVGGDGRRKQGYVRTGADDPEAWQYPLEPTL